jgi:hypothetical protein
MFSAEEMYGVADFCFDVSTPIAYVSQIETLPNILGFFVVRYLFITNPLLFGNHLVCYGRVHSLPHS